MTLRLTLIALAATCALEACTDSSSVANFNPAMTGQKVDQAFSAVDSNQAVQSLNVMSSALTFTGAPPAPSGSAFLHGLAGAQGATLGALQALANATTVFSTSTLTGLFPSAALGKTFVYNTQTGKYQVSDLPGAPANGVRYLLYAVDRAQRMVITPLQQIGTLDLTDKSSAAANTVGIQAVVNGITVLQYDASGSVSGGGFSVSAKGYVVNGSTRLDFDLSQSLSATTGLSVDYKINSPTVSLEVVATATVAGAASATLTVTESADKLEINIAGTGANASGTVKYNGSTLATISVVNSNPPVFTAAGGRVLTGDDLSGLKALFNRVDIILNRFDDLLAPSYFVFGL